MKISASKNYLPGSRRKAGGFTLVEMLFAVAIMMVVIGAILATNLLGMRMMEMNETKLAATDWSRNVFDRMTEEVRSCDQEVYVGTITNSQFSGLLNGEPQIGNALLISNTSSYIMYFLVQTNDAFNFRRYSSADNSALTLADSVTNNIIFTAQDIYGNVLTNNVGGRVIHLALDIYQPAHYLTQPEYYQLETSITRRALQ